MGACRRLIPTSTSMMLVEVAMTTAKGIKRQKHCMAWKASCKSNGCRSRAVLERGAILISPYLMRSSRLAVASSVA